MHQADNSLFPEIDYYHSDWLQVDELHQIYYEECGNPNGRPVVFLHGGPGSGCNSGQRRFFDPKHYRIILLDQRSCGRSKPQGELHNNTTDALIADLEKLRAHLNIDSWHVFGGSWGSTLALAYTIKHAHAVISLTLRGIFLSRPSELNWFLGEIKYFYPDVWQRLLDYLPIEKQQDVLTAFEKKIASDDLAISHPAAIAWNCYESSIISLDSSSSKKQVSDTKLSDAELTKTKQSDVSRARVQIHYIRNQCFVDGKAILTAAQNLAHIPTTIVQGRYDMVCPPETSWLLSKAMSHADYIIVQNAGHSAMEPGVISALVSATEKYKTL